MYPVEVELFVEYKVKFIFIINELVLEIEYERQHHSRNRSSSLIADSFTKTI